MKCVVPSWDSREVLLSNKVDKKLAGVKHELKESTLERLKVAMVAMGTEKTPDGAERTNWDKCIAKEILYLKEAAGVEPKKKDESKGSDLVNGDRLLESGDKDKSKDKSKDKGKGSSQWTEARLLESVGAAFHG